MSLSSCLPDVSHFFLTSFLALIASFTSSLHHYVTLSPAGILPVDIPSTSCHALNIIKPASSHYFWTLSNSLLLPNSFSLNCILSIWVVMQISREQLKCFQRHLSGWHSLSWRVGPLLPVWKSFRRGIAWVDWKSDKLDPEKWGWLQTRGRLEPRTTDLPPVPDDPLKIVRCQWKTDCDTRMCTCKNHGLECSDVCGEFKGISYTNSLLIPGEELNYCEHIIWKW